jgi:ArsR family transcriptional regulator
MNIELVNPREPIMTTKTKADPADRVFGALASKPRREILRLLASGAGAGDPRCCGAYDVCACRFSEELGLSASTVSHHMHVLSEAGMVTSRKEGLWVYYRIRPEAFEAAIRDLAFLRDAIDSPSSCS